MCSYLLPKKEEPKRARRQNQIKRRRSHKGINRFTNTRYFIDVNECRLRMVRFVAVQHRFEPLTRRRRKKRPKKKSHELLTADENDDSPNRGEDDDDDDGDDYAGDNG